MKELNRKVIETFDNKPGQHCISTSLRDIFQYNGFSVSEEMIFGLDGGLGFHLCEDTHKLGSLFVGGKSNLFEGNICNNLGIKLIQNEPQDDMSAWLEVKEFIDKNTPVMVFADMYYLDYFQKKQNPFGGHMIVIIGYDLEKEEVYVSERLDDQLIEKDRNELLSISFSNLQLARSSEKDYINKPNRRWFVLEFPPELNIKLGIKKSIKQNAERFLNSEENGIKNLHLFPSKLRICLDRILESSLSYKELIYETKKQLLFIYACIEKNGTGGGLFRKMYSGFLSEIYKNYYTDPLIYKAYHDLVVASEKWSELASNIYKDVMNLNIKIQRDTLESRISSICESANIHIHDIENIEKRAFLSLAQWIGGDQ
ncbi:BtrH N-terminal domain-containing protein [Paenibacillus sp. FSL L8-0340]|uniref:BtrH N-terminal domain-containing protein n=1 Tax=Paenibacillus sp. FSL L8-0340 TaxID=2954685 RepID=UPI003158A2A4